MFNGSLDKYMGPLVSFDLDQTIAPIQLKVGWLPFALKP